jgi:ADP-ribose pyrophosphatase
VKASRPSSLDVPSAAKSGKMGLAKTTMRNALPDIRLELVRDLSPQDASGFLRLKRRVFRAHYPDGTSSAEFVYDEVDRRALDATVIAAHYRDDDGERAVYLRSALRPPVVFRDRTRSPLPDEDPRGSIWELPAGLVEDDEQSAEGLRLGAARELQEELGFAVDAARLLPLGPGLFPCAGVIAERHYYFEVEVDPALRGEPNLDGSALERDGVVVAVPLSEALAMCRDGRIVDGKTEVALRRLRERFP